MATTTVTPSTQSVVFTTYAPTATVGDIQIPWTGLVFGANAIDRADADNGGICQITGVWYPARLLKTVNGRRMHIRIPIEGGVSEPSPQGGNFDRNS